MRRVMAPGGRLEVKRPHGQSDMAYAEPWRRYAVSQKAFEILDPQTERGAQDGFCVPRKGRILEVGMTASGASVAAKLQKIGEGPR